ncbi:MAG: hypothetical protein ABIP63_08865 [Thermoanaerobaculia bacterium]
MGDETKETLLGQGNPDPLHAPRKPTTADSIEEAVPPVAQMASTAEVESRKDRAGRGRR